MSTTARWITVASAADIPVGSRRVLRLEDQPIAVFHLDEGWYAIDDVCTHDGGELAGGPIDGYLVECLRHGAKFDLRTGEAVCPPAYTPTVTFPVRVEDGAVWTQDNR